jgi:glucose 1-dehydrogenase
MNFSLAGKIALVTGAARDVGGEISRTLAELGATVAINYNSSAGKAEALVHEIEAAAGKAKAYAADVADYEAVKAMAAAVANDFGTIDILVNNAGLQRDAPFDQMTLAQWNFVLGVNLSGQFLCAREALREFKRRGIVREVSVAAGKIICISSVHEVIPWSSHANYAASKGGIMLMMKTLAQEGAPFGVRVNSICPGAIRTPINTTAWDTPAAYAALMTHIPYKRIGEPEDIGRVAVMLASDLSDYITGASIFVDGGMTLYPEFATGG